MNLMEYPYGVSYWFMEYKLQPWKHRFISDLLSEEYGLKGAVTCVFDFMCVCVYIYIHTYICSSCSWVFSFVCTHTDPQRPYRNLA